MNKRGLSGMVVTLLLILLAIAASIIIWSFIKVAISDQSEISQAKSRFFTEVMIVNKVTINQTNPSNLKVLITRKSGKTVSTGGQETPGSAIPQVDMYSVIDLSGSMKCDQTNSSYTVMCSGLPCEGINRCDEGYDNCVLPRPDHCGGSWLAPITSIRSANYNLVSAVITPENNSRLGMVGYHNSALTANSISLTANKTRLNATIDTWQESVLIGFTCICCGINNATFKFQTQSSDDKIKIMIVMSDGLATRTCPAQGAVSPTADAIKSACDANSTLKNLTIYTVGLGNGVDVDTMQKIASCGNGEYFQANITNVISVYQSITQKVANQVFNSISSINYIKVVFYNANGTFTMNVPDLPEILETKSYDFNLPPTFTGLKRIEIYPVILINKKEITGPIIGSWDAP